MRRTPYLSAVCVSSAALAAALALPAHAQEAEMETGTDTGAGAALFDVPSFADVEPDIAFPTCIGIARILDGAVTQIPVEEGLIWDEQFDLLGDAAGRTVAVLETSSTDPAQAVADLRADGQAAALDYIVIYELAYDAREGDGASAVELLRLFPTFEGEQSSDPARAAGAAVLLDVAGGEMYGVASAVVIDTEMDTEGGAYAPGGERDAALTGVVAELAHEVETAFVGIMIKSGMPEPQTAEVEGDPEDLTQEQIIAMADREIRASYDEQSNERGC